jgi:GNAT superfamily N-acetyltransferase
MQDDGRISDLPGFWKWYVAGTMRYSAIRLSEAGAAVAVWIPPAVLNYQKWLSRYSTMGRNIPSGASRSALIKLDAQFDGAHLVGPPHALLGFLATHPHSRGRGIGQRLLASSLDEWDAEAAPTT